MLLMLLTTLALPASARELDVIYPSINERPAGDYGYRVLELALAKSGERYRLQRSSAKMNVRRAKAEIVAGRISVIDIGTSREHEESLRPVYFPIDRGLSGYRLFVIHRELADAFATVRDVTDLRRYKAGQGPGWADAQILEAAGITVITAPFESLFAMVDGRRFDFFPLGVEEVFDFLDRYRDRAPHSIIEPQLAIHYPFARLFFVRRDDTALHDALLTGLRRALADGSLQRLLDDTMFGRGWRQSRLAHRRIIRLDNPLLTDAFRAMPKAYFIQP